MKTKLSAIGAFYQRLAAFFIPRKLNPFVLSIAVVICLLLLPGCGQSNAAGTGQGEGNNAPPTIQGYHMDISLNGKPVATYTIEDFKKMESFNVVAQGKESNGPRLSAVLQQAGISDYSEVKIIGVDRGRMANVELTLKKAQVTAGCVFDITNRGTTKFASPEVAFESWVYDATALEVK